MNEIIICVGISGSGKSTWTTNFIKENPNCLRINRDNIRATLVGDLDGYYQRKDLQQIERIVNHIEDELYYDITFRGFNVIIDNTNLKQSYINRWIKLNELSGNPFDIKFKLFDISYDIAVDRVRERDNTINTGYIIKQHNDYQLIKEWIIKNYKDKIIE